MLEARSIELIMAAASEAPAEERLKQLENVFSYGGKEKGSFSTETLLDILLLLYDECCNSTLRRDKNISEFIENGKWRISIET